MWEQGTLACVHVEGCPAPEPVFEGTSRQGFKPGQRDWRRGLQGQPASSEAQGWAEASCASSDAGDGACLLCATPRVRTVVPSPHNLRADLQPMGTSSTVCSVSWRHDGPSVLSWGTSGLFAGFVQVSVHAMWLWWPLHTCRLRCVSRRGAWVIPTCTGVWASLLPHP